MSKDQFTAQELFDLCVNRLADQGKPAVLKSPGGLFYTYETEDGLCCPVGLVLTSEEREAIKQAGALTATVNGLDKEELLPERFWEHFRLLSSIQECHDADNSAPLEVWRKNLPGRLRQTAKKYNLHDHVVDTLEAHWSLSFEEQK